MFRQRVLVWLMVGLTIAILAVILIPIYQATMLRTKESVLQANLTDMRQAIKAYTEDKRRAPQTLQDLVDAGYFRQLPVDPITHSNSSWKPVTETERGIKDLHSGSVLMSTKGTMYSSW